MKKNYKSEVFLKFILCVDVLLVCSIGGTIVHNI